MYVERVRDKGRSMCKLENGEGKRRTTTVGEQGAVEVDDEDADADVSADIPPAGANGHTFFAY